MGHGSGLGVSVDPDYADDGCVAIRPGESYDGKQGISLSAGISSATAGSRGLCMHMVVIPPGSRGTPHLHEGHETAIYIASGEVEVWHGPGLTDRTVIREGDFFYIPSGTEHLPVNKGDATAIAVLARTDPAEQESVVLLDLPGHLSALRNLPVAAG